jgi:hypothetical protein
MEWTPSSLRRYRAAFASLFLPISPALAQDVLWSPPQTSATPAAVQERQDSNPMQVFAPSETTSPLPLQLGPVTLHPHVDYQFSYGNGLQSSAGQSEDSIVQQIAPGILLNMGDHWTLDYTPTFVFYSSSAFRDVVNQSVNLGWGTAYGDWFFSGSQSCSITSDPNIETGSQSDQDNYSTALNASYQFNDKMSVDLGLGQTFSYVGNGSTSTNELQNLANSKSWSTMDWLNYQFWPRLNAGISVGGGYTIQDNSPDSVNEQYQGRVNWRATDKISFQLSGGVYVEHYLSGGQSDLVTPIFSGTIQYQPFEQTRLSLTGSRTVSPSSYQNQSTENDQVTVGLNQRLLGRLYLDLSGGYGTTKYNATDTGVSTSRSDDVYTFSARLSCAVLRRGTVAVFYAYSENSSSQSGFTSGPGYGYTSNQVGFEIGYRY